MDGRTLLLTSRQAGAKYLARHVALLNAAGATHVRAAVVQYPEIADWLRGDADCVKLPWDVSYTLTNREKEVELLRQSR